MRLHSRNTAYQASLDMPLLDACEKGNIGTVQRLLRRGANPNGRDDHGRVPVIIAAQHGHTPIVALLIQYGADLYATDHNGWTALHHAVYEENADAVHDLVTQLLFDPNIQDRCGQTPFLLAAENGNKDMLRVLVQLGADPHITDQNGRSALHYAVLNSHPKTVRDLIIHHRLDPNIQDAQGITPFMIAAEIGDIPTMQFLVQHGADPYMTDPRGRNALYAAIRKLHQSTLRYLITQLNLDPNIQDHQGITPFMIAAEIGHWGMLRRLANFGANPHAIDHQGRSALHYAARGNARVVFEFLITCLHIDPNQQDHEGNTPLLIAMKHGNTLIARTLIQLGAHPRIPNHQGETTAAILERCRHGFKLLPSSPSSIIL